MAIFDKITSLLEKSLGNKQPSENHSSTKASNAPPPLKPMYNTELGKYIFDRLDVYLRGLPADIQDIEKLVHNILKDVPVSESHKPSTFVFRLFQEFRLNSLPETKDYYIKFITALLDTRTYQLFHPSFIEIFRQLSVDEIRIMKLFTDKNPIYFHLLDLKDETPGNGGKAPYLLRNFSFLHSSPKPYCENVSQISIYYENLARLGIITISEDSNLIEKAICELLRQNPIVQKIVYSKPNSKINFVEKIIILTTLGEQFASLCSLDHNELRQYATSS